MESILHNRKIIQVILLRQIDEETSNFGKPSFSKMTEKMCQIVILKSIDHFEKFIPAPYSNFLNSNQAQIHHQRNFYPYQ